jgi:hypothetical protein
MARTGCGWHTKTSQNSSRVARTIGRRISCSSRNFGLTARVQSWRARLKARSTTVSELVSHYRKRELDPDTVWKTHSTKVTYEGYLNKWILPRWQGYALARVNAGEVELWLRSLPLAKSSCAKIRNLMSVVFNHGIRHEICDRNPIQLVRQSAKRGQFQWYSAQARFRDLLRLSVFGSGLSCFWPSAWAYA